jgi:hypothetical protein
VSTQRAGALVWITRILIVVVLPCPLLEVFHRLFWGASIRIPQPVSDSIPGTVLRAVVGWLAIYFFLVWTSAKIVCGLLAIVTIAIALHGRVEPRTRALTVGLGSFTCCLLVWWVNTAKHW